MSERPVLICAATGVEARGCRTGIEKAGATGRFEVLQTGMGLTAAERALRTRLERGPRPARIVSSGVAGSKCRELGLGDWVLASAVTLNGREPIPADGALAEVLAKTPLRWRTASCRSREAVSGAQEDLSNGSPLVVDMESYALAQVAAQAGIPFAVFRLISDTPEQPIPDAVGTLAGMGTARGTGERVKRLWSGSLQVLTHPVELAGFVGRSVQLPAQLASGWEAVARAWRLG